MAPALIGLISLLSGASALIFETLWFRLASLTFGSSTAASSIVLASFMGGLALGSGLAAWPGDRAGRAVRDYAFVELTIGVTGLGLCRLFPVLESALGPFFSPLVEHPSALNAIRLLSSFLLMMVPATSMGATLPLLVRLSSRHDDVFGRMLGRIYGFNTAGAVLGAVGVETLLVPAAGLSGSAVFAACLNAGAAGVAFLAFGRRRESTSTRDAEVAPRPPTAAEDGPRPAHVLLAAALAGGILLGLEVVWFRFLQLFVISTGLALTLMLAVVLLGIALGGFLGATWIGRRPLSAANAALPLALFAGASVTATYTIFRYVVGTDLSMAGTAGGTLSLTFPLVLPTSLLSGVLFTLLGQAAERVFRDRARAAGLLTLSNTLGAMCGALLGGFLLLPQLGTEPSLLAFSLAYAVVALLLRPESRRTNPRWWRGSRALQLGAVVFAVGLLSFPLGLMSKRYLPLTARRYYEPGVAILDQREGMTETIVLTQRRWRDRPVYSRLITNGFSMSGTHPIYKRYMKLYVYWPMAVHPDTRNALLISFGVGSTARALTDTKSLETIDIVDVSRDILEMRKHIFTTKDEDPLEDPRVRVHIEDGRQFLRTTNRQFDLITGEPPPPKAPGIVNLYTKEYFDLVRSRLAPGGITTYWLPVDDLLVEDSKAIARAFCDAFADCTLWAGSGLQWMLVGTREAKGPVSEEAFARQWRDPVVGPEMRALGFEQPEQLGALFLGDASDIAEWIGDAPTLDDDHPSRLSSQLSPGTYAYLRQYEGMMNTTLTLARFKRSPVVARLWPESLRERTLPFFEWQSTINEVAIDHRFGRARPYSERIQHLHEVLTRTTLRTLPIWMLGTSVQHQALVEEIARTTGRDPEIDWCLALNALAAREYDEAQRLFANAEGAAPPEALRSLRLYSLAMGGRDAEARALAERMIVEKTSPDVTYLAWLVGTFWP